ncbi:uncharacterized protein KIAA1211-like homolog, partial [Nannospalax galili]|uniref:uncharacterized protein KIAA1211-like homolog n=1 Tax=Nannospalax galili TaxID=1026970 RepID=UPI000819BA3F
GKKKRKETPSSTGNSTWKQNQAKSEVIAIESGPVGYDSEDELEESRGTLGSRALSHDSIFFPESGQDPARPVRVFSQENVCDRIKALQMKIQCNVKMGPPPPGGLPIKRAEDTGMSSEDDGLPRSPPEMSLMHDVGPSTTIKISLVSSSRSQSPDHTSDVTISSRSLDGNLAPVADFSHPPEFSSCLDNSAAKHKLLVKPRRQRSTTMRRLSSRAQSESLSDLTCTPEEEENEKKPLPQVSTGENTSSGQQDLMLDRQPETGGPATLLPPGGARARRARLQHSPALSASMEEGASPGDEPSSRPATPDVTESRAVSAPHLESSPLPEGSPYHVPHSEVQKEELSIPYLQVEGTAEEVCISGDVETPLSTDVPERHMAPSQEDTAPSEEDIVPSKEDIMPPKRDMTPPREDTPPPKMDMAPPKEDTTPPKMDMAPPKEDTTSPRMDMAPPREDTTPPKMDMAPPKEDTTSPRMDMAPPREDTTPPKMDMAPPKEDTLPKMDMAPPREDTPPLKMDMAPPKGDTPPLKGDMVPPREDTTPPKMDIASHEGDTTSPKMDTPPPRRDTASPETVTVTTLETTSDPEGQDQNFQKEEELTLVVPRPEGAGTESSTALARSPPGPKSCLKHRAATVDTAPGAAPVESPQGEPSPGAQGRAAVPSLRPRPAHASAQHGGPERAALGRKSDRGSEQRSVKKFSVTSCRARSRGGSSRPLEHSGRAPAVGRMPLLKSGPAWKSEAALDDLQVLPEPQDQKAEGNPRDSGDMGTSQAGPGRSPQNVEPGAAVQEPAPEEDLNPFPVKLRSTSLSLKYRDGAAQEAKAVKRYSAEVRLERGSLALLPKDEQSLVGATPILRGARSPNGQGKGKARSPEQPGAKPPLPRKPLLQSLTLQYPPVGLDASPGEPEKVIPVILPPEPRKEKSPHRAAEKGQPPATESPGADGQPTPPWITMARQKRRGTPDQPPNQEDKPGSRILKTEAGKQAKEPLKQADFVRSKSFLMTPAKPAVTQRQGSKLSLKEGLQRGISLSHQNLAAQAAGMTEKELHQLKRASYTSTDQPSWMELARKKSQAWSDMPQIIK